MKKFKKKSKLLYLIMHDIRSAWNVGSMLRTADATGVDKVFVCGYTCTPDHHKIAKTALGAEKMIPWEQYKQTWRILKKLKSEGVNIVALEQTLSSENIFEYKPKFPLALIVGNEVRGIEKKILKYADNAVEIPMHGGKESLNVAVAAGIGLYEIIKHR